MDKEKVFAMNTAKVYALLIAKVERKDRTRSEMDEVTKWLTGYTDEQLAAQLEAGVPYGQFFKEAPHYNPDSALIRGTVCGVRVETVEDPLMKKIRQLDKLADELAKGKSLEKILRKP